MVARFTLDVAGVDPTQTLSEVAATLSSTLEDLAGDFKGLTEGFSSDFDEASDLMNQIASSDKIKLSLDATIDFSIALDMSLNSFDISSSVDSLKTSFRAKIVDQFDIQLGGLDLSVFPSLELFLEAENTATPFDVFNAINGELSTYDFGGEFNSTILVSVQDVPAQVFARASSDNITDLTSIDFELGIDIDLQPIKDKLIKVLDDIGNLDYPAWLTDTAPFLPSFRLFVSCVRRVGKSYLSRNETGINGTYVVGFLKDIQDNCFSDSLSVNGGYNSTTGELQLNAVANIEASTSVLDALDGLKDILPISLDDSFFDELSVLEEVKVGGSILIDLSIEATIDKDDIGTSGYGDITVYARMNRFEVTSYIEAGAVSLDFPINLPGDQKVTVPLNKATVTF